MNAYPVHVAMEVAVGTGTIASTVFVHQELGEPIVNKVRKQ